MLVVMPPYPRTKLKLRRESDVVFGDGLVAENNVSFLTSGPTTMNACLADMLGKGTWGPLKL